ncbi:outer dense fiber protein 2-like isoform X2 [Salmo trutta]|uniref:outer dense fiber protein 2-like isoform X2 n=1 Tax=Salmo trutta TaxID=8032 RepID=UPI001131C032|nr:outer dense fiber protein 2-like isoform X2 [Salmo trutta]XP_029618389.1 outer dense fiber protein 2-like isoform X2 [Salmo trutta]
MPACHRRAGGGSAGFHQRPGPWKMREHLPPTLPKEETESLRTSKQRQGTLERLAGKEAEKVHLAAKLNNKGDTAGGDTGPAGAAGGDTGLLDQLEELKQQSEEDKESLKQADQTQWQRAEHSKDSRQLSAKLLEKEAKVAEALFSAESWCTHHSKEVTAKRQLEVEITVLKNQVTEMTAQIHTVVEKGRAETGGLLIRLHRFTSDNSVNKLENQRLKRRTQTQSQSEAQQLKSSVKKLESQVENYKSKVDQSLQRASFKEVQPGQGSGPGEPAGTQ